MTPEPGGAPLRIAILEASHWHVPLYLGALQRPDVQVVAVCDDDLACCHDVAAGFGAAAYASFEDLLQCERIDFAFAFGEHVRMPVIGAALIARRIPFAIEKPCGLTGAAVSQMAEAAAGLFVAVPLVFRLGPLFDVLLRSAGRPYEQLGFRFMGGPASRYPGAGCGWMLDPARAGGGCAMNLAPHFIDLFHCLTGQSVRSVSAIMRAGTPGVAVEDHAALLLTGEDGPIGTVETSYSFPLADDALREFSFSLSSPDVYIRSTDTGLRLWRRGPERSAAVRIDLRLDPDASYGDFVTRTLADLRGGRKPLAGLQDAARVMHVMDAAYRSAQAGGAAIAV